MSGLYVLTDAELDAVSGGGGPQSITIYAGQHNISNIHQVAIAVNAGPVSATASGAGSTAAAVGASASNVAYVSQANLIGAHNVVRS
jgi:hypothetical protein